MAYIRYIAEYLYKNNRRKIIGIIEIIGGIISLSLKWILPNSFLAINMICAAVFITIGVGFIKGGAKFENYYKQLGFESKIAGVIQNIILGMWLILFVITYIAAANTIVISLKYAVYIAILLALVISVALLRNYYRYLIEKRLEKENAKGTIDICEDK